MPCSNATSSTRPAVRSSGGRNDFPGRSENDGGIQLDGRLRQGAAGPLGSELKCELLVLSIPCRCINFDVPVSRHLDGNMGGGAKSVETQLASGFDPGKAQAAEADNSGTEQRSSLLVAKFAWDGVDKVLWSNNVLRVAAVDGIARERGMVAKIFGPSAAVLASAVGVVQPGNAYPLADWKPPCVGP